MLKAEQGEGEADAPSFIPLTVSIVLLYYTLLHYHKANDATQSSYYNWHMLLELHNLCLLASSLLDMLLYKVASSCMTVVIVASVSFHTPHVTVILRS
jgi:hypothetical protein